MRQQSALGEVLRVIASTPTDLQHVLEVIATSTVRLCGAESVTIRFVEGDALRRAAAAGSNPSRVSQMGTLLPISHGSVAGRAVLERATIHVPDLQADLEIPLDEYPHSVTGARLATPIL